MQRPTFFGTTLCMLGSLFRGQHALLCCQVCLHLCNQRLLQQPHALLERLGGVGGLYRFGSQAGQVGS